MSFTVFLCSTIDDRGSTRKHKVCFQDVPHEKHGSEISLEGVPFMVVGSKYMECHQGPQRRKPVIPQV